MIFIIIHELNKRFQIFYLRSGIIRCPFQIAPHPIDIPDILPFHINRFCKRSLHKLCRIPKRRPDLKNNYPLVFDFVADIHFGADSEWWTDTFHPVLHYRDNFSRFIQVQGHGDLFNRKQRKAIQKYNVINHMRSQGCGIIF
jgi:hypothetical protein